ncbi:NAD(P)H-binding protein [Polyangium sp. 15x6]|uniref:NAD(P)H-binding protein n=1 Tax=Polyangium sp. 15x6 TaxID=3042687 RepID=UPI00249CC04C|nr:NAD(P)H-binding protein [Polyangium sp. 15x6]MDI3285625.1 NAD(P)H-binding protein [Polyangium sp. 15x6]
MTGASGNVGSAAVRLLASRLGAGAVAGLARDPARAAARVPSGVEVRRADYTDRASLDGAFAGGSALLFVASDGDARDVMKQHENVIDAIAASSIERVVFTSIVDVDEHSPFYFAPVYRDAERRLRACGKPWCILRCGMYSDFMLSQWLEQARDTGVVDVPAGRGRIAPISRDDVATAAALALESGAHEGQVLELAGVEAYTLDEITALASRAFGRLMTYRPVSATDYLARCWATMEDPWPHAFASLLASVSQDRFAVTTAGFERIVGRRPEELSAFLERHVEAQ